MIVKRWTLHSALCGGVAAVAVATGAAPALVFAASGMADRCAAAVDGEIERLGLDDSRIAGIAYIRHSYSNSEDNSRVTKVLGWVDLADCQGYLVVDMTPRCRVRQVFTQGACAVPGVPSC